MNHNKDIDYVYLPDELDYRQDTSEQEQYESEKKMSEPSIADEQFQYFVNEVKARCDTNDIYILAGKLLGQRLDNNDSFTREELIDNYLLNTNVDDLTSLIADAIKRREIDYD